jgi:hypothetical protein
MRTTDPHRVLLFVGTSQAGDKVKAMKALLRSGDAEKIIFFAGGWAVGSQQSAFPNPAPGTRTFAPWPCVAGFRRRRTAA